MKSEELTGESNGNSWASWNGVYIVADIRPCFNNMEGGTDSSKLYSDLYTCIVVHMFLNWLTHITETIKIQKKIKVCHPELGLELPHEQVLATLALPQTRKNKSQSPVAQLTAIRDDTSPVSF